MPLESLGVDWGGVLAALGSQGWVRLAGAVPGTLCDRLADAAPTTWSPLAEREGSVRQGGLTCGAFLDGAQPVVRDFAEALTEAANAAVRDITPVPPFNETQWGRDDDGVMFITAHRDPPTAGGIIAVLTISGAARFRVWNGDGRHEWDTGDGDLVLLCGRGWPSPEARCPLHEVESPRSGARMTLTLRHNSGGAGADYFPLATTR